MIKNHPHLGGFCVDMLTEKNFLRGNLGGYHKADKSIYLLENMVRDFDLKRVKHTTAKSLNDIILHEIGHYYHWRAVEKFYKQNKKGIIVL